MLRRQAGHRCGLAGMRSCSSFTRSLTKGEVVQLVPITRGCLGVLTRGTVQRLCEGGVEGKCTWSMPGCAQGLSSLAASSCSSCVMSSAHK